MGNLVASSRGKWKGDKDQWILFSDIEGLVVEGNGELNGQGSSWWEHKGSSRPTVSGFFFNPFQTLFGFFVPKLFVVRVGIEVQELQQS